MILSRSTYLQEMYISCVTEMYISCYVTEMYMIVVLQRCIYQLCYKDVHSCYVTEMYIVVVLQRCTCYSVYWISNVKIILMN